MQITPCKKKLKGKRKTAEAAKQPAVVPPPPPPTSVDPAEKLPENDILGFLANGYVLLENVGNDETNKNIIELNNAAMLREGVGEGVRNHTPIGNNCIAEAPELRAVIETKKVKTALRSILGDKYILHPHVIGMNNDPGSKCQTVHKDSFFGFEGHRHHTPWWVMAMYYPQDTPIEMAATSIIPGSQYYASEGGFDSRHLEGSDLTRAQQDWSTAETQMTCKAGTLLIVHYDLFHRGMNNTSSTRRWMFKYEFLRVEIASPYTTLSWNPSYTKDAHKSVICEYIVSWLNGAAPSTAREFTTAKSEMQKCVLSEHTRVSLVYEIALSKGSSSADHVGRQFLSGMLASGVPELVRTARHGFAALLYTGMKRGYDVGNVIEELVKTLRASEKIPQIASAVAIAFADVGDWSALTDEKLLVQVTDALTSVFVRNEDIFTPNLVTLPEIFPSDAKVETGIVETSKGSRTVTTNGVVLQSLLAPKGTSLKYQTRTVGGKSIGYHVAGVVNMNSAVRTGCCNVKAGCLAALCVIGSSTTVDVVVKSVFGVLSNTLQRGVHDVPNINGDMKRTQQGEILMEATVGAARLLNAHPIGSQQSEVLALLSQFVGKVASQDPSKNFPRRPGAGGHPGADQGLRYSMGLAITALLAHPQQEYIHEAYATLYKLRRLPPESGRGFDRAALLRKRCHLTTAQHAF
eukprot:TRINITY_DN2131_c0_g1_i5.p1 TRINITY_DN2131_c0_g1~~TRINITY_DN2131_c0_g1_i5.p1  ORF type:complete len:690 (+),score=121.76 TRINITY_DN2131_c0_g1_i5:48-2117(+)